MEETKTGNEEDPPDLTIKSALILSSPDVLGTTIETKYKYLKRHVESLYILSPTKWISFKKNNLVAIKPDNLNQNKRNSSKDNNFKKSSHQKLVSVCQSNSAFKDYELCRKIECFNQTQSFLYKNLTFNQDNQVTR